MPLEEQRPAVIWSDGESFQIVGPENLDTDLTPELRSFLGGEEGESEIEGVRLGDRVFIASDAAGYLGRTCLFFDTKEETRRQARILGELPTTPILGSSFTTPAARGRGVHKRLVGEVFRYLQDLGYRRVVCEIDYENIASQTAKKGVGMSVCRQISDWKVLDLLVVQKVKESGRSRWRCLWIG
jgi:RimJ/RimL family protein N-acetyltransferase